MDATYVYGLAALIGALGALRVATAVRRCRDRAPAATAVRIGAGLGVVGLGALVAGWGYVAGALLAAVSFGGYATALVIVWRRRRERHQLVELAVDAGATRAEAHQMYRTTPAGPIALLGWYFMTQYVAIMALVLLAAMLGVGPSIIAGPTWPLPQAMGGMDAAWWIWGLLVLDTAMVVHMAVNAWRTPVVRRSRVDAVEARA